MAAASKKPRVTQGAGMFNLPKVSYSKETQDLLKVMMNESKLTNFQQRQLKSTLQNGRSLPLECNPTSSSPGIKNGRQLPLRKKKSHTLSKQGLRSKQTIDKVVETSSENDTYRPMPSGFNSTKEKAKLQNVMAYGTDLEPVVAPRGERRAGQEEDEDEIDRFAEVLGEIEERREFLADMAALGQDKPYRNKIVTEISQRLRELEQIDKSRYAEINKSELFTLQKTDT